MTLLKYMTMVLLGFLTINIHAVNTEPILKPTAKPAVKTQNGKSDVKQSNKFPGEPWKPKQKSQQFPGENWQPNNSKAALEPISP